MENTMTGGFSIGAVAKLTGLSVHNIRAWERRHQAISAERTDTGRRVYTQKDLDRLTLLKQNINAGRSISMIAGLSNEELQEFLDQQSKDTQNPLTAKSGNLAVGVFGNFPRFANDLAEAGLEDISQWDHQLDLEQNGNSKRLNLLIGEIPSLGEHSASKLKELMQRHQADKCIIVYRFASEAHLRAFEGLNVTMVKAPVARQELLNLTKSLLCVNSFGEVSDRPYPHHIFTNEELNLASQVRTELRCECPSHLSEILRQLNAFEEYSVTCATSSPEDAALHKHIQQVTAQARYKMELVLRKVLELEQIDLRALKAS